MNDSEIDIPSEFSAVQYKLRYSTACQHCPVGTSCSDVIGCDACPRGKQQADCIKGRQLNWKR